MYKLFGVLMPLITCFPISRSRTLHPFDRNITSVPWSHIWLTLNRLCFKPSTYMTFPALSLSFNWTEPLPFMNAGVSFLNEIFFAFYKALYDWIFSLSPVICFEHPLSIYHWFSCPSAYKAIPHLSGCGSFILHVLAFETCSFWVVCRNLLLD